MLEQWMIDAGATFLDANGVPTRPDGTPVQQFSRGGGLMEEMAKPANPLSQPGPPQIMEANTENPLGYAFGPGYAPSNLDSVDPTPLAPTIWNMGQEAPPDNATEYLDYSHGDSAPANWKDYKSTDRSTAGGFFTAGELFGANLPMAFQSGSDLPSTNNWRLLPMGKPGYIMRNGQIINLNSDTMWGPHGEPGMDGFVLPGGSRWRSGAGAGVPAAYAVGSVAGNIIGWPGQLAPWGQSSTPGS
jgi:hypothetical protein